MVPQIQLFTCVYSLLGVEKPALDRLLLWYHVIDVVQAVCNYLPVTPVSKGEAIVKAKAGMAWYRSAFPGRAELVLLRLVDDDADPARPLRPGKKKTLTPSQPNSLSASSPIGTFFFFPFRPRVTYGQRVV